MLTNSVRDAPRPLAAAILALGLWAVDTPAATLDISGPPGASVRLNGQDLGLLPLRGPIELEPGVYRITCRARGCHDLDEVVLLADPDSWMRLRLRPQPLRRKHAVTASFLYAGLGQWYSGARLRGWVYFIGESGGLLVALASELQRQNHRDDYLNYRDQYDGALQQAEIERWRALTDQAYRDMQNMTSRRNTGLYVAAGAWAISLLDAWLLFPGVDIGPGMVPPTAQESAPDNGLHARISLRF